MTGTKYKVGDSLAFKVDYGRRWEIYCIMKITPSGRMICGPYTLNPDLKIRGERSGRGPYSATPVTPQIQEMFARESRIRLIKRTVFENMPDKILKAIADIITEFNRTSIADCSTDGNIQ